MVVANVNYLLTRLRSLKTELLLKHSSLLRIADLLDLHLAHVFLVLLILQHLQKFVVESLAKQVHLLLGLLQAHHLGGQRD